jgi:cytidylate kinase
LKIIGFVGMPGSGKSVASDVARHLDFEVIVMGDIIRQEAARLGLPPTDENLGMVGSMLRAKEGPQAIARRTLELAKRSDREFVAVDGLRSRDEVDFFRTNSEGFRLIEICASSEARRTRIAARGRSDDAKIENEAPPLRNSMVITSYNNPQKTADALEKREIREMGWGIGEAFKEADMRMNNNGDLDEFKAIVESLLKEIKGCSIYSNSPKI